MNTRIRPRPARLHRSSRFGHRNRAVRWLENPRVEVLHPQSLSRVRRVPELVEGISASTEASSTCAMPPLPRAVDQFDECRSHGERLRCNNKDWDGAKAMHHLPPLTV